MNTIKKQKIRFRPAFTLPMVMLIAMIAAGMISAIAVIYENYVGRSTIALEHQEEYNLLVNAAEKGRNLIRGDEYPQVEPSSADITSINQLEIRNFDYSVTIANKTARVFVEIYDSKMEGNSSRLAKMKNDPAYSTERKRMPTLTVPKTSNLSASDAGTNPNTTDGGTSGTNTDLRVYTIRAHIEPSKGNRSLELLTTMDSRPRTPTGP